jgi:type IV secretion system protein VirD4
MLDEFPALGRLETFEMELAFMASYGLKAFLIAQSLNQLDKAYGQNNSILDNCHIRVAFATNDERTAKRVSEMLGTKTEQRHQRSYTGHRLSIWLGHVMVSQQETQRPLLTPGEVMQLPPDHALILASGAPPLLARKLRYFKDDCLRRLVGALDMPSGVEVAPERAPWDDCFGAPSPKLAERLVKDRPSISNDPELDYAPDHGSTPADLYDRETGDADPRDHAHDLLRQARFMAMSRDEEDRG